MTSYHLGVWTPTAAVLCLSCHGPAHIKPESWARRDETITILPPDEGATTCDKCGTAIAVHYGIAAEHELAAALNAAGTIAYMAQTGGMCSAVEIPLGANGDILSATLDDEIDDGLDAFLVGYYPFATAPETEGFRLHDDVLDAPRVVDLVRDIVSRYRAGERTFGTPW